MPSRIEDDVTDTLLLGAQSRRVYRISLRRASLEDRSSQSRK